MSERDYKDEYSKFQKAKTHYRSKLNKYNRSKGTYGNRDGKDASHEGGGRMSMVSESKNRGRRGEGGRKRGKSHNYPKDRKS